MFFLAFKHLWARPRQSLLTMMGIALGCAAFVAFAGLMNGFQGFIIDQLVNNDAHIRISARDDKIEEHSLDDAFFPSAAHTFWLAPPSGRRVSSSLEHPEGWFQRLTQDPRVLAYSPQLKAQVLVRRGDVEVAASLVGMKPESQVRVTNIQSYMREGDFAKIGTMGNHIVLGSGLANKLGSRVSENVMLAVGTGAPEPFKVVGIFHLGVEAFDYQLAFAALPDVQRLKGSASSISDIAVRLVNVENARAVAEDWSVAAWDLVRSWDQISANVLSVFKIQDFSRSFMTISILVVAAFGVYNILNILVNQKRRDIAILRSMGFDEGDIMGLFLIQGLTLGFLGGVLGLLLGYLLCLYIATLEVGGGVDKMVISYDYWIYITGFSLSLLASSISSLLPSRAAGKLNPIEVIRSGG